MGTTPTEVVVVGAGLAGLAVATHLARRGRSVQVLDRMGIGSQASAQNAGMLRRMGEDPYERALAMRSHEVLRDDPAFAGASRQTGAVLAFGRDPGHLHDAAAHVATGGVPRVWREGVPHEAPVLAGAAILGAWWLPEERVVDAWSVLQVLHGQLRDHGGAVKKADVVGIEKRATAWRVVLADRTELTADRVVLAAGAWSAALARSAGLERPLFPLRRTVLQTQPHPLSSPSSPWVWVDDEGVYVRPEAGGFLLSGCDEVVDFPVTVESRGPVEMPPRALALSKLERWMPCLDGVELRGGWTGLRTFAPDRRPVLGADPEAAGLWWVAGLGGFGVSCGLSAGALVAGWMEGEEGLFGPRGVAPGRSMLSTWMVRPRGDLDGAVPASGKLPSTLVLGDRHG